MNSIEENPMKNKMIIDDYNVIKIDEKLIPSIESGEKTATLRKGRRGYLTGQALFVNSVNPEEEILVDITLVRVIKFKDVSLEMVLNENCASLSELKNVMLKYYPDLTDETECTYVKFDYLDSWRPLK